MKNRVDQYVMFHYCQKEHVSHCSVSVCRERALCMQKKPKAEKHATIKFFFFFGYKTKFLLQPNLSVYVCESPSWRLESRPLPPTSYSIYTCRMTAAPRVRDGHATIKLKLIVGDPSHNFHFILFYLHYQVYICERSPILNNNEKIE